MKRCAVVVLLFAPLAATPLLAGDSRAPGDPVVVMNRFYRALRAGNLRRAEEYVIEASEETRRQKLKKNVRLTAGMLRARKLVLEARASRVEGNWAVVVSRIETSADGKRTRRIRDEFMFRQEGEWKIVPEALRSDPAVRPLIDDDFKSLFKWYRANLEDLRRRHLRN